MKNPAIAVLFYTLLILLCHDCEALLFTEIMFDLEGSDSGREWLELYNNGQFDVNLSELSFYESGTNHRMNLVSGREILASEGFAVIVDKPESFFDDYPGLEVSNMAIIDSTFSLSNSGEYISIRQGGMELAVLDYSDIIEDLEPEDGHSIFFESCWHTGPEPGGTPGSASGCTANRTQNQTPQEPEDTGCDASISIFTNQSIFSNSQALKFQHTVDGITGNFTIGYWIDDIFNKTLKPRRNTTNTNKKSWTPNMKEEVSAAIIKAFIYPRCNDTNLSDNYAENIVIIRSEPNNDNLSFEIRTNHDIIKNQQKLEYSHIIDETIENFTIEYWIDDLFNNTLKERRSTTNTNKKSWTPSIDSESRVAVLKAKLYPGSNYPGIPEMYAQDTVIVTNRLPGLCNASLSIYTNKSVFENKEPIRFKHIIAKTVENYTIEYWIDDIDGNAVKKKRNTTNTNLKSYTPSIDERHASLVLRARVYPGCRNPVDDYSEKIVIVKNPGYKQEEKHDECGEEDEEKRFSKPEIEYSFQGIGGMYPNSTAYINATVINNDNEDHYIRAYTYLYRGNKCYSNSGNRTANIQEFVLKPRASKDLSFRNIVDAPAGEYKLRLVINKDRQKTDKYLIRHVNVTNPFETKQELVCNTTIQQVKPLQSMNRNPYYLDKDISSVIVSQEKENSVIYKAKDMIIKEKISNFLIAFLAITAILVFLTRFR